MRAVERAAVGHVAELTELYERHALWAVRFAYMLTGEREIAEDVVQDAFLRTFDRLTSMRNRDAFPGYLRMTILNGAKAYFRRRKIEGLSLRRHALLVGPTDAPSAEVEEREHLWQALRRLPYRHRAALVLRYYEDLSERDAARALGTTLAGMKALVSRAKARLRTELREDYR